ncbi:MAG: LytTR family DNA-binding domain-containing protein [Acidobacteria bacterium]|nr:LytTR family DNA-binding domain-containing protein [Acidobacteriota bacterium]
MSVAGAATALIADDEPALRGELERLLAEVWPELILAASVGDGVAALDAIERLRPDVAFLDIRMPPPSGLDVARQVGPDVAVVFVTAYDAHAVEAFERAAVDYLLKPVAGPRLQATVSRLKRWLGAGRRGGPDPRTLESLIRRLADAPAYLHWLRVGQGEQVEIVAVDDVCFFRSDRKYTAAVTRDREHLVRTSIAELQERLDPERFWRIHRGGIVNVAAIEAARRDLRGRYRLTLRDRPEVLRVSAAYGHLFRRM